MPNRLWTLLFTLTLSGGTAAVASPTRSAEDADPEIEVAPDDSAGPITDERTLTATPAARSPDLQLWASHEPGIAAGWTARLNGEMVGELNLVEVAPHHGLIDSLWAAPDHEERIVAELFRAAVAHAHEHSLLKLTVDTRYPAELTLDHLDGHGIRFSRMKPTRHGATMDFYLDLQRPLSRADRPGRVLRAFA